jgi:predicted transcriptional regulator
VGKMNKKRESLEVIYDLLKIIQEKNNSIRPTPLYRYSNLNSARFNEYYKQLLSKGLVKEIKDKHENTYITLTDFGFKYIEKYSLITGFMNEFDL